MLRSFCWRSAETYYLKIIFSDDDDQLNYNQTDGFLTVISSEMIRPFLQILLQVIVVTMLFGWGLGKTGLCFGVAFVPAVDTTFLGSQPLVLCYHQIRNFTASDSKSARIFIVSVQQFSEQMKFLHDHDFHPILPDQWISHIEQHTPLPSKPVLLTFDDGTQGQYDNARPVLEHYGFKATFFIMTVTIGKKGYLNEKEISALHHAGHTIGCHTWDHHDVRAYTEKDWQQQLVRPTQELMTITGSSVRFFAYPFGSWNDTAIVRLKAAGYVGAFQLNGKNRGLNKQFTLRRIIVDGHWSLRQMQEITRKEYTKSALE